MLASVIYTSTRMINESKTKLENYYSANRHLEKMDVAAESKALTVTRKIGEADVAVFLNPKQNDEDTGAIAVNCITNDVVSKQKVTAYRKP